MLRRKIGILGGMGPMATQAFYRELILHTDASVDQDHLEVVIESSPSIADRTAFLLGRGPDPRPALMDAALRLKGAGAELIVMPCNSAQAFAPELEEKVGVPFLDWVAIAADGVAAMARPPVAVLATAGTLEADIYGPPLEKRDIAHMVPSEKETAEVMACIYEFKAAGYATESSQERLIGVADGLRRRGARAFLLACTELPLVLPSSSERWPALAIDPAVFVAQRAVVTAGARLAERQR